QQERMNEIHTRAMEEVLGERSRRLMRIRLEEMAYYLLRTDRHREALWAVAAAQSLEDDNPHRLRRIPLPGRCSSGVWTWRRHAQAVVVLSCRFRTSPEAKVAVVVHSV